MEGGGGGGGGVCVRLTDEHPESPHSPVPRKIMNHKSVPQISLCVLNARSVRGKKLERAAYICDYNKVIQVIVCPCLFDKPVS